MPAAPFASELARYGPESLLSEQISLPVARLYCRRLAQSHYENFTVASWLLPRRFRQHFYNVYAYCRRADDLADELDAANESLALLDWWEEQLAECYSGRVRHPVFVALAETIAEFKIPEAPFRDLLTAFRQDQHQTRYATFEELLGYCRCSANPVGRLVLHLGRCHTAQNAALADEICTGLQLANFWQDVARDFDRGRIYIPQETLERFGCDEDDVAGRTRTPALRAALAYEVERAEGYLQRGRPLAGRMPRGLRIDIELFAAGGLAILRSIRRQDYDVWSRRPTLGKLSKLRLFFAALLGLR